MTELLERQEEIAALETALAAAVDGHGRLVMIEAEAGTGKSSLLGLAGDVAVERDMLVLRARAGEHEREFAYAVIRQLFEARVSKRSDDGTHLSGAAAFAAPVFDISSERVGADRLAIQHGLYWLTADVAAERPLALLVDDAHWADGASLQALLYIARRLDGLPVALVAAVRTGEPDVRHELLDGLRRERGAQLLIPGALSVQAAVELGRRELGAGASERFLGACHVAAAGNPFLLIELFHALTSEGVAPTDANADEVAQLASAGVARSILLRLARLGDEAVEVARCVAVLEPNAETRHVAALAGVPADEAAALCDRLIRARILADARPVSFAHPLIREAVYGEISAPRRAILHTEAARRLSASGAPTDSVAAHLLRTPPAGQEWVVVSLRAAASEARARGAPEVASEYLQRALSEPAREDDLLSLRRELGSAMLEAADERGIDELMAVRAASDDPVVRAELNLTLGPSLSLRGRADEALSLLDESIAELDPSERELLVQMRGHRYQALGLGRIPVRREQLLADVEGVRGETRGERHLLTSADLLLALGLGHMEESVSIASRVAADPDALVEDALSGFMRGNSAFALALADQTELALELIAAQVSAGRRRGSSTSLAIVTAYRALILLLRGELVEGQADGEVALELMRAAGMTRLGLGVGAVLPLAIERGDLAAATELLSTEGLDGELAPGLSATALLCARGALWSALGRHADAREDFLTAAERVGWLPYPNPEVYGWRPGLALAELALARHEEALALAAEAAEIAREAGGARGIGITLRVHGVVAGEDGIDLLRAAVETLAPTSARLHHAKALVDLGAALRRSNRRRDSREPLQTGMELARRCGARPLEERARTELAATGARPRTVVLSGVESLTPSELRVAKLAAVGTTNREIAQGLFVSVKTVEYHLRHCFQKLDIERRTELGSALAIDSAPVAGP